MLEGEGHDTENDTVTGNPVIGCCVHSGRKISKNSRQIGFRLKNDYLGTRYDLENDMKIIIVGPAHPYRGGIAAFSQRLAEELISEGHEVSLVTFTLQYPSFLFPGKTQYSEGPAPEGLTITRKLNSINPFNWIRTGRWLKKQNADMVLYAYWHPFMAPALGTVARICRNRGKQVGLLHNFIPHSKVPAGGLLSKYFASSMESFIALSESVKRELRQASGKECMVSPHPLYDNFGSPVGKTEACEALGLDPKAEYLLSFGLIRAYKGLDILLKAYSDPRIDREKTKLIVAGEFYSGEEEYHRLASELGVDDQVIWRTEFVPDDMVRYYFGAADIVVQPYKSATQSGVTQIAYNFEKPMIVTRVGALPEIVPDGKCGYVVEPAPEAVADALADFTSRKPDFSAGLAEEKKKYSWQTFCHNTIDLL